VETVEWAEEPKTQEGVAAARRDLEKTWVRVRIEAPDADGLGMLYGLELNDYSSFSAVLDAQAFRRTYWRHMRSQKHAEHFRSLLSSANCQKPEFKDELWALSLER